MNITKNSLKLLAAGMLVWAASWQTAAQTIIADELSRSCSSKSGSKSESMQ